MTKLSKFFDSNNIFLKESNFVVVNLFIPMLKN